MNLAESESDPALLADAGAHGRGQFLRRYRAAVRQSRRAVRRLRRDHPEARLIVTGCAATIDASGFAAMDEVDGVIPNSAKLDPRAGMPAGRPRAAGGATPAPSCRSRTAATMPAPSA
jgi:threonylcarbamoyladenosine tRNA methylthiotransferase MtaB